MVRWVRSYPKFTIFWVHQVGWPTVHLWLGVENQEHSPVSVLSNNVGTKHKQNSDQRAPSYPVTKWPLKHSSVLQFDETKWFQGEKLDEVCPEMVDDYICREFTITRADRQAERSGWVKTQSASDDSADPTVCKGRSEFSWSRNQENQTWKNRLTS
jgi:hypothetical protein